MSLQKDNILSAKIEGYTYKGAWANVHIKRSMQSITGAFAISNTDFFLKEKDKKVYMGSEIKLAIDDQTVITGYVDIINMKYHAEEQIIIIKGRDKTGDLVDCPHTGDTNEWKKQKLSDIIKALITPFDLSLVIDTSVTSIVSTVIPTYKINEGQKVAEAIGELCRDNGILALSKGDGKLTLTKVTTTNRAVNPIQSEVNIYGGEYIQDDRYRHSNYTIKGIGIGNDDKQLVDFIEPYGEASDSIISRHRPCVIFSENATDSGLCQNRAKWEACIRAGFSRKIVYELPEWVQSTGELWDINMLVRVKDSFLKIDDTMLISDIDYILDKDGIRTIIQVVDKDTFSGSASDIKIKSKAFDNA